MEARLLLLLWKSSSECMPINDDSRVEGDHFLGGAREGVQIKAFSSERRKLMNAIICAKLELRGSYKKC